MESDSRHEVDQTMRAAKAGLLAKRHGVILEFAPRT